MVKPEARGFALIVLVTGLAARLGTIVSNPVVPLAKEQRIAYLSVAVASVVAEGLVTLLLGHTALGFGTSSLIAVGVGYASYRTQGYRETLIAREHEAAPALAPKRPLMMLPGGLQAESSVSWCRPPGNPRLIQFALKEAKNRQAELAVLFVRHLAVTPMGPSAFPKLDEDEQALALFDLLAPALQGSRCAASPALRRRPRHPRRYPRHGGHARRRSPDPGHHPPRTLWRAMKGDVIQAVAEQLPGSIDLLIHAGAADRDEEARTPSAAAV